MLRFHEVPENGSGNLTELLLLPLFPDEGFHHPNAVEILLHHIVQPVIGLEHPVKNLAHLADDKKQAKGQQGHDDAIDDTQPGTDPQGHGQGQNQHHPTANGHADHHLERILQIGHVGGEPGHNGGQGKPVHIGKGVGLHLVKHVLAQIFRKSGCRPGGKGGREDAKAERRHGTQQQQAPLAQHIGHIVGFHPAVHKARHEGGNQDLHGHLSHHHQGGQYGISLIFPDATGKPSNHNRDSSFSCNFWQVPDSPPRFWMARPSKSANAARSAGVKSRTISSSSASMWARICA